MKIFLLLQDPIYNSRSYCDCPVGYTTDEVKAKQWVKAKPYGEGREYKEIKEIT